MNLHARLVAPEVRILVEIPVRTLRPRLSFIRPMLAVKRLPENEKRVVVLNVRIGFHQRYRHFGLCHLIVFHNDRLLLILIV